MNIIKKHFLLSIFLILYFLLLSYKLISYPTPFFDWDESINVQVAKETFENKSLVPLWQSKPWLDKPALPFLIFGGVMKITPFIIPEISLRLFSLILSLVSLVFIYVLAYKSTNHKFVSFLTVLIASFAPIYLQRSQIVNLDVFLLIGWLGYLIFVQNFWLSFVFLALSVLTKSLIGFYPVLILIAFYLYKKKYKLIKGILLHAFILSLWYLIMYLYFGNDFWQQHIVETHFRRVTSSIESHFGQRTFYLDLMYDQLGLLFGLSIVGLTIIVWRFLNRKLTSEKLLYSLYLFPWFIFLNLTKTKIFWYLYPAIPQFAYLCAYPLILIKNRKIIFYLLSFFIILLVFYQNFIKTSFFTTFYSRPEDYYQLSLYAKKHCDSLSLLVGKESREATKTLTNLGLTITSTKQWGDHPSIVYYFGKRVDFIYDKNPKLFKSDCFAVRNDDLDLNIESTGFKQINSFNSYFLFKR